MKASESADLRSEYLKNLQLSKMELDALDSRTRYTAEGTKNAAKQKVEAMRPQVLGLVLQNSLTVFLEEGVPSEATDSISDSTSNVQVLDYLSLEKALMSVVYPQSKIKGYNFNSEAISRLNNALIDVRTYISADFIPPISASASQYKVLPDADAALAHLRSVLDRAYGNELRSLYLAKQTNDLVEKLLLEYDKFVFFVVNTNMDQSDINNLTGRSVRITKEDNVPEDLAGLQLLVTNKLRRMSKKTLTQADTE